MRMRSNNLIVIENGKLDTYMLDDRTVWEVGRPSRDNIPDIVMRSPVVSRKHGRFHNMDGLWFYLDLYSKNGTTYNGKRLMPGLHGRGKPVMIKDGDVFVFGGGDRGVIDRRTVWGMYRTGELDRDWRVVDTEGLSKLRIYCGDELMEMKNPMVGSVVDNEYGLAIYMGNVTYLNGKSELMR
jgi:pSer/pThr/pTyr-binding forkhead associated (FHA) protein